MFGKPSSEGGAENSKKRHALYKSRMAELAQYRKILQKQGKKNGSLEGDKDGTSKHIDKYRHK